MKISLEIIFDCNAKQRTLHLNFFNDVTHLVITDQLG